MIGRALRRQSYDLNEDNLFNVEYADVLGIPFDFNAKPVVSKPQPPRETVHVKAVKPKRDALEIRFPRVEGYRVELPNEHLEAEFNDDSVLELTPMLVGPTRTRNAGIIGEAVDLELEHLEDVRTSAVIFRITKRLLYKNFRDPGNEPELHLFGKLKRIAKQWFKECLVCKGKTFPAQLFYQELADMACEKITAGITRRLVGEKPVKAILDSQWEGEFCRVVETHPMVLCYVKNHNLGLEVPYRMGSELKHYRPDFIVVVNDGESEPLNLIIEIKGYRGEDAKIKKETMDVYWIPGVNNSGRYGRWAFAEFTDAYEIEKDFEKKIQAEFAKLMIGIAEKPQMNTNAHE